MEREGTRGTLKSGLAKKIRSRRRNKKKRVRFKPVPPVKARKLDDLFIHL